MTISVLIQRETFMSVLFPGEDQNAIARRYDKAYLVNTLEAAEEFAAKVNSRPTGNPESVRLFAVIVESIPETINEIVPVHDNMEPVFMHTLMVNKEVSNPLTFDVHTIHCFTVGEIESFRTAGINPSVVYAYDNQNNTEPNVYHPSEIHNDYEGESPKNDYGMPLSLVDEDDITYVTFNEDWATLLNAVAEPTA